MISYTKKVSDPLLPLLRDRKTELQISISKDMGPKNRNKSYSQNIELSFLANATPESEMSQLKQTFKATETGKFTLEPGRQMGNYSIGKPKFTRRKPDIVPR
jgi:hypothetical protein